MTPAQAHERAESIMIRTMEKNLAHAQSIVENLLKRNIKLIREVERLEHENYWLKRQM